MIDMSLPSHSGLYRIVSVCMDLNANVYSLWTLHTFCYTTVLSTHIMAVLTVRGSAISDACLVYYCQLWLDCVTTKRFWSAYHFLFNGYSCVRSAVNVLLNANVHVSVFPPLYDLFSSCFAAGALVPVEPSQAKTIYQAVVDKNWRTARDLLFAVRSGKQSGSVWSVSWWGT